VKKGQVGNLGPLAMTVIVAVIVIAVGSLLLNGFLSVGLTSGLTTTQFNSTITSGQSAMTTLSGFVPLISLAVVAMIVIGLFMGFGRAR
jgi:type IV secretory pathway VirB2 component (pilin)